jgi:AraC-like DNA-binding protein
MWPSSLDDDGLEGREYLFADESDLSESFQRHVGVTPSEYRRRYEVLSPN